METYINNQYYENLIKDYWDISENHDFRYTQKYLINKFSLRNSKHLESIVIKHGYGFIDEVKYYCILCNTKYKFKTRKEFKKFTQGLLNTCDSCHLKKEYDYFKKHYIEAVDLIANFQKIYRENHDKKFTIEFEKIINSLDYLNLIYLHLILSKLKYGIFGKIKNNEFNLFLHTEFYENNLVLKNLYNLNLIFYCKDKLLLDYLSKVKNKISTQSTFQKQNSKYNLQEFKGKNLNIFDLILKPNNYSFIEYNNLILNKINNYKFNSEDLISLIIFLKSIRKCELIFLITVVKYNTSFNLKKNNSTENQIEYLSNNKTLKESYSILYNSVYQTLYILDYIADSKRCYLKNSIYSNIVMKNKNPKYMKINLPKNYKKSHFIKFIESEFMLGNIWEEMNINSFIKILIDKLQKKSL